MKNDVRSRLTKNEALVAGALEAAGRPLKAYDLLEALRPDGVKAPMTVYRALDGLAGKGIVHKLEALGAFMLCESDHAHDHASEVFVICKQCGDAREIDDCALEARVRDLAARQGFHLGDARLEMSGVCARCKTAD